MTMLKNNYTILECEENWPLPDGRALHLTWPYLALPLLTLGMQMPEDYLPGMRPEVAKLARAPSSGFAPHPLSSGPHVF